MQKFKVYLDEKVTIWQRIEIIIEAESEEKIAALIDDYSALNSELENGNYLDISTIDTWPETIDHLEYDFNNVTYSKIEGV